jgi:N-acetylglutamate synthase-like GNAT family acetyltransferase
MNSANFRIRRATLDDLDALRPMWEAMRFQTPDLERRLTEFQVAEDASGNVVGGIAFQISERHANIHSETFSDFALAESVRPLLWERIQALARNHGIARLWTRERAPFWKHTGFAPASSDALKKFPEVWGTESSDWWTLPLKDEDSIASLEKELEMFMAAEKQRTARALNHAKNLKHLATAIAILFAIFVAVALFYIVRNNSGFLHPGR